MDAADFTEALPEIAGRTPVVVYADPPYSRAQYSRYYHVLETLVLYDYPAATGKGRYRDGRVETDFSRPARVSDAIDHFIGTVAASGYPLYLSYPENGLLFERGEDLLHLLGQHYPHATVATTAPLAHSTLGGAPGTPAINVVENVYYGRWD
jgi:adenine-specific DNA-methyltransferase